MDLTKLFEIQAGLDYHIMKEHPELRENESNLDWKILALQVELGECANEWRGFKKWSNDQEPRVKKERYYGTGIYFNPLLDEYVDCLHFILSIGLEKGFDKQRFEYLHEHNFNVYTETETVTQFNRIFYSISEFITYENIEIYEELAERKWLIEQAEMVEKIRMQMKLTCLILVNG